MNFYFFVSFYFLKVDMEIFVGDWIVLDFLKEGECGVFVVFVLKFDECGGIGDGFDEVGEFWIID